jgi:hypothetical protein
MANTVSILDYTNTFGDWVNRTNALAKEVTDIGKYDFHKNSGTLFLDSPLTGLQVANNVIIGGVLQVQGIGSSAFIQNNLTVSTGQVYFSNTTLGLTNAGKAIVGGLLSANGSGIGLNVANNTLIQGTTTITGSGNALLVSNNAIIGEHSTSNNSTVTNQLDSNTLIVSDIASIGNDLSIVNNTLTRILQANSKVNTATLSVTGTGFLDIVQANTSVNTATLSVTGTGFLDIVQANTLNVIGTGFLDIVQANTSVNTATLTITNTLDAENADGTFNNLQTIGQLSVGGNFVINGTTVYNSNSFTLNAGSAIGLTSYVNVNRGSTGANSSIRWNETTRNWDILDISGSTYYRILTNQNLSDSVSTANSTIVATAQAANTLNESIKTANTSLKSYVDTNVSSLQSQITSNVSSLQSQITSNVNVLNASVTSAYSRANTSSNTFNGTSGSAAPSSGIVTFSSGNGVTTSGSGSTLTINTAQDIRTSASPTFNGLILTNALPIAYGGTGSADVANARTTLLPTGTTAGYVLTTGGAGSFYWSAPSGGSGGATPGTTINSTRLSYTATAGQTLFTAPTYIPGTNQLRIYQNGVRQYGSEYTETTANTITLTSGCFVNDVVLIEVDGYYVNPLYANNTAFTVNSLISSSANTIQLAIDGLVTVAAPKISPSFSGVPLSVTPALTTSNTMIATTGFVYNALANTSATYAHSISGNAAGLSATLAVASGGTGVTTSTGSGSNVLSTSPTFVTPVLGIPTSGTLTNCTLPYSKLTGTVPTWNQDTTGNANYATSAGTVTGFASGGIAEIGRYIDFHGTAGWGNDYDVRLDCGLSGISTGQSTLTVIAGGGLVCNDNITAYSDIRLKENIKVIPNALDKVNSLRGVTFTRNDASNTTKLYTGVIAQEVLEVLPEAVTQGDTGIYSVAYGNMVGLLIEAIKELKLEIDILKGNK